VRWLGFMIIILGSGLIHCKGRNYALECLDTAGKRPCVIGSIKYDANAHECACKTKHRGEIEWDIR